MSPTECPHCRVGLSGDMIPVDDRHHYGHKVHFSRVIGVGDGDSIGYWKCPDCGHEWERNDSAFAEQARKNIDAMRKQGRAR